MVLALYPRAPQSHFRALEELFDRPIEIYSSEAEDLRPMKIDFDASEVSAACRTL